MGNNTKKNVVLLIPQLRHGGAERVVSRLSFLLKEDFNVKVVVFDDSIVTYDIGCELTSLKVPSSTDNNIISKGINVINRIIKYRIYKSDNNIEITYSFGDTANIINILSKGKDRKIISIRGYKRVRTGKTLLDRLFFRPISILLCRKADRIVSVSELITQTLITEYNLRPDKVITIYNGYDVQTIRKLSKENLDAEESKLFKNNDIIITAGTYRHEKGYWHLLKSFSIVMESNKNIKLVILGTDYKSNRDKIVKLAKDLCIEKSVILLGYKENPYKYFNKSKIYVLSSVFEGFPNALVEAMSCGLPVVAADCPSGPREILSPSSSLDEELKGIKLSEYGILVPRMNSSENYNHADIEVDDIKLAEGISKLLEEEMHHKYVGKSFERSDDFGYITWLSKQKKALSCE